MYPIDDVYTTDVKWQNFEKTGSIISYLRYKGVNCDAQIFSEETDGSESSTPIKDGESIGYY